MAGAVLVACGQFFEYLGLRAYLHGLATPMAIQRTIPTVSGATLVALIASLLLCALPSAAEAHGGAHHPGLSEARLVEIESELLGPGHAREHAMRRRAVRQRGSQGPGRTLPAGSETVFAARLGDSGAPPGVDGLVTQAAAGPAATVGAWSPPFAIPVMAINAALLPTGKVIWWAYPQSPNPPGAPKDVPNTAAAWLWDPATGRTRRVDPPVGEDGVPANIWCSGLSFIPDGRLLVTGGNLAYSTETSEFKGLEKVYTFNPFNETWTEQPPMRHGRWYPTQVLQPEGESTVILSGLDETGDTDRYPTNRDVEVFRQSPDMDGVGETELWRDANGDPVQRGNWGQPPDGELYPHMFVMPSGRTLLAGPAQRDSWLLTGADTHEDLAGQWEDVPDLGRERIWSSGVIVPSLDPNEPSTRALILGGWDWSKPPNDRNTATTEEIDETDTGAGWSAKAPLTVPRSHLNTVLLPDGSMVTVGGGHGNGDGLSPAVYGGQWAADAQHRQVELWDPETQSWHLGAAQAEKRAYHSTALLLPDGRVISAGDDYNGGTDRDTAEIYEPPYLFTGQPRPTISAAPQTLVWGQDAHVTTPDSDIESVSLVALGATTHANDMNQRFVPVAWEYEAGGMRITPPAGGSVAPPGWYMLFLVDSSGAPSVARFVRLDDGSLPAPPPRPEWPPDPPDTLPPPPGGPPKDQIGPPVSSPDADRTAPRATLDRRSAVLGRRIALKGGAFDDRRVVRVDVALAARRGARCRWWTAAKPAARARPCVRPVWVRARLTRTKNGWTWKRTFAGRLKRGRRYLVAVRAVDAAGNRGRARRFAVKPRATR